jgi:hypothetical protein
LNFAKDEPTYLTSGARVRVRGVRVQTQLALSGDNTRVQTVALAPLLNAIGERTILMILVNFEDNAVQPFTSADAQNVLFGTTSDFFVENSYQRRHSAEQRDEQSRGAQTEGFFTLATRRLRMTVSHLF